MTVVDPIVEVQVSADGRTCTLTCPHCGRQHSHGLGERGDLFGDRMAHCHRGGYVLARPNPEGGAA